MTNKDKAKKTLQLLGLIFSAYAVYESLSLTIIHLSGTSICPLLWGIPACIIIFACYSLITIAWTVSLFIEGKKITHILFFTGFAPAFLLALIGSLGETFNFTTCPHTMSGFPKCFISFVALIVLAIAWAIKTILNNKLNRQ